MTRPSNDSRPDMEPLTPLSSFQPVEVVQTISSYSKVDLVDKKKAMERKQFYNWNEDSYRKMTESPEIQGHIMYETTTRANTASGNVVTENDTVGIDGGVAVTPIVAQATDLGGTISIDASGNYTYTAPENVDHDASGVELDDGGNALDSVDYTITDRMELLLQLL